jgi:uncharacterized protein (TIGR02246 family)
MWTRIGMSLTAVLMLCTLADAQDDVQKELLAQERKLIDAINKKNAVALRELLAEEAMSITASGGRVSKDQIVSGLEKLSFTDYRISDVETVNVSPDVAILTYKFSWTGGVRGKPANRTTAYATSVWKRRDGKWRSVFYQETPIAAR